MKAKFQRRVRIIRGVKPEAGRKLTDVQLRILETLENHDSLALPELLTKANAGSSSVSTLQKRKLVEVFEERVRRNPLGNAAIESHEDYDLTEDQLRVLAELDKPLRARAS